MNRSPGLLSPRLAFLTQYLSFPLFGGQGREGDCGLFALHRELQLAELS